MSNRKSPRRSRKAKAVTLDKSIAETLAEYTVDGLHNLRMACFEISDVPWLRFAEEEDVALARVQSRVADFSSKHPAVADSLGLGSSGLEVGEYRYYWRSRDCEQETVRCVPLLRLLAENVEDRIRQSGASGLEKAHGFLAACASHIEQFAEQEAVVYLASRGEDCTRYAKTIREFWRKAADRAIEEYAKPVWGTVLGTDEEFKVRGGIPVAQARDVLHCPGLPDFWGGRLEQDETIDATMLRTVDWGSIGGFDPWWQRWAERQREGLVQGGVSPWPGGWHLFNLCRSDLAIRLLGDTLDRYLWAVTVGEVDKDAPWRLWNLEADHGRQTDHYGVASAITFATCRIPRTRIDAGVADSAASLLLGNQNASGGWMTAADQTPPSIITTAMVVHALCLKRPVGWEFAAKDAAKWLWQQQDPLGYWYEEGCPDAVWLTVLVLDAIDLADGNGHVTFRLPASSVGPAEIESVDDRDPTAWAAGGLPHHQQTVRLMHLRHEARQLEPHVRDESGIPGDSRGQQRGWQYLKDSVEQERQELEAELRAPPFRVLRHADGGEVASLLDALVAEARKAWSAYESLCRTPEDDVPPEIEDDGSYAQWQFISYAFSDIWQRVFESLMEAEQWFYTQYGPGDDVKRLDEIANAMMNLGDILDASDRALPNTGEDWASRLAALQQAQHAGFEKCLRDLHQSARTLRGDSAHTGISPEKQIEQPPPARIPPCPLTLSGLAEFTRLSETTIRTAYQSAGVVGPKSGQHSRPFSPQDILRIASQRSTSRRFSKDERARWNDLLRQLDQPELVG